MPFTQLVDGRLWHNAGVVGLPCNNGTSHVWYSVITPGQDGLEIEHCALHYAYDVAVSAMRQAGLPPDYASSLATGVWPSCDVLPARERLELGAPLTPGVVFWQTVRQTASTQNEFAAINRLLWPAVMAEDATGPGSPQTDHLRDARSLSPRALDQTL